MPGTMPKDDDPKLVGEDDSASPEQQELAKAARTSLKEVAKKIRASVNDSYFERMQACLAEAWATCEQDASTALGSNAAESSAETMVNSAKEPAEHKKGKGYARDPDHFPSTLDRVRRAGKKEKKSKTVVTYFASIKGKSKNKKVVSRILHLDKLDSKVVTQANIPASTSRVPVNSLFFVKNNTNLDFVPGQMDPDSNDLINTKQEDIEEYWEYWFDTKKRARELERGSFDERVESDHVSRLALEHLQKWQLSQTNLVDAILDVFPELDERCLDRKVALFLQNPESIKEPVFASLESESSDEETEEEKASPDTRKKDNTEGSSENTGKSSSDTKTVKEAAVHDTLEGDDQAYLKVIDTPCSLYCPRCKLYCCNLHLEAGMEKASLQLRYETAMNMERRRGKPVLADADSPLITSLIPKRRELSHLQKSICRRVFLIYQGDYEKIATFVNAPVKLVEQFCRDFQVPSEADRLFVPVPSAVPKHGYYNVKNYPKKVRDRNSHKGTWDPVHPCLHDGDCEDAESNCTCVENRMFCSKTCGRGVASSNFHRGCNCKGPCQRIYCSCFANHRECDPDLCGCSTCTDPPGHPTTNQSCRNDGITMRRQLPTYVAVSEIPGAGYGLFSRYSIPKDRFIAEYVGEILSEEESERRGKLYDILRNSHSSIFLVTDDEVIDACNMCNEMRFMNQDKKNPNVRPIKILVNGDTRIGFFAARDIPAQTEMLFDYGYQFSTLGEPENQKASGDVSSKRKAEPDGKPRAKKKRKTKKK